MPSATKKRLAREQTWFDSLNPTTLNVINSLNDTKESNDAAADAEGEAVEARKAEVLDLPTMAETTH